MCRYLSGLQTDIGEGWCSDLPILQAFLYQINGYRGEVTARVSVRGGPVVRPARRPAALRGRGAVRVRHGVGGAVRLALVAVLVVGRVVFRLAALDLAGENKRRLDYNCRTTR